MIRSTVVALTLLGVMAPALADDAADTVDTLSSPWRGAALRLASEDKRFVLAVNSLFKGFRIRTDLSAPLDDETRTAAFVGKTGLAPGFRGALYLGYDSTYRALDLDAGDQGLLPACERAGIPNAKCTQKRLDEKLRLDGKPAARSEAYWGIGVEASYAYDRQSAFMNDVATNKETFPVSDLQVDASAVITWPNRLTLTLRAGYERSNQVSFATFRRCVALPSTDMSVSGTACGDAKYVVSDPDPEGSYHARAAVAYYPDDSLLASYISATELRTNLENLSTDTASFDVHLLAFLKGIELGDSKARIGLGATVRTAVKAPEGADYQAGDIYDYSLFGVVGTSF
jgi:hypothetical protein